MIKLASYLSRVLMLCKTPNILFRINCHNVFKQILMICYAVRVCILVFGQEQIATELKSK